MHTHICRHKCKHTHTHTHTHTPAITWILNTFSQFNLDFVDMLTSLYVAFQIAAYLICLVISVDKQHFPIMRQGGVVNGKAVVLWGNESLPVLCVHHRLVVPSATWRTKHATDCMTRLTSKGNWPKKNEEKKGVVGQGGVGWRRCAWHRHMCNEGKSW